MWTAVPGLGDEQLKCQFSADLPPARQRLGSHSAKVYRAQIALNVLKVRVVEKVKKLKANLEIKSFRDVVILINRRIGLDEGGVAELTGFLVAVGAGSRHGEFTPGEDTRAGISTPSGGLLVAGNIGITEVISIGQVVAGLGKLCVRTGCVVGTVVCGRGKDVKRITRLIDTCAAQSPRTAVCHANSNLTPTYHGQTEAFLTWLGYRHNIMA